MVEELTGGGELSWRNRITDGTWSPYRTAYHRSNIVGTVSQTAGVPTGAIIQRGANANGQFTRFADGTAEYWGERQVTGVSINPARSGNGTTSMDCADPLVLELSNKTFTVTHFYAYNASNDFVFTIPVASTDSIRTFMNLGTRPSQAWPQLDVIGTAVITRYVYQFRAIGRWY